MALILSLQYEIWGNNNFAVVADARYAYSTSYKAKRTLILWRTGWG